MIILSGIVQSRNRKEQNMDARELTKKVQDQENRIFVLEKEVSYLRDEVQKLRLLFNDLDMDVHTFNFGSYG